MQCAGQRPMTTAESPMPMIPAAIGHIIAPSQNKIKFLSDCFCTSLCLNISETKHLKGGEMYCK